jgi:hypothetical protein
VSKAIDRSLTADCVPRAACRVLPAACCLLPAACCLLCYSILDRKINNYPAFSLL